MVLEQIKALVGAESVVKGTSLITLYLPAGGNLWLSRDHVNAELKTTPNIKNKNLGKAVAAALRSISYQLKILSNIPPNGLVICAGDYSLNNEVANNQHL